MTSISMHPIVTPQVLEMDKNLKEKYGPSAHVIPIEVCDLPKNPPKKVNSVSLKDNNKDTSAKEEDKLSLSQRIMANLALAKMMAKDNLDWVMQQQQIFNQQMQQDNMIAQQAAQQALQDHMTAVQMTTPGMGIV